MAPQLVCVLKLQPKKERKKSKSERSSLNVLEVKLAPNRFFKRFCGFLMIWAALVPHCLNLFDITSMFLKLEELGHNLRFSR